MARFALLAVLSLLSMSCATQPQQRPAKPDMCAASRSLRHVSPLPATSEGMGAAVVMIGGGLIGNENWAEHSRHLRDTYLVIRLQNMAVHYGLQDKELPADYSVRMESCAVRAALDQLGLRAPVHLAGHSLGALIALDFALHHPDRVRTLTLSEPPAAWLLDDRERQAPDVQAWERVITGLRKPRISETDLWSFLCAVGGCPAPSLSQARQLPWWADRLRYRRSLRGVYAVVAHRDDPELLVRFDKPTLYIAGTGTAPVHRRFNAAFARAKPTARILTLPGGHSAIQVSLQPTLKALEAHLALRPTG